MTINAQPGIWSRQNPPSPLKGRNGMVTITNQTCFISIGGRDEDNTYSQLSLGYDVTTQAFVETKTSLYFDRTAVAQAPDGTYWAFGGLDSAGLEVCILL